MPTSLLNLSNIVKEIEDHPHLKQLIKENEVSEQLLYLSDTSVEESSPEDFKQLLNQLNEELCGSFITNQGQHSKLYYQAVDEGYKLKVVERDSFGPLVVRFSPKHYKWFFCYG